MKLPSSSSVVERPQIEDNVSTTDQIAEEQAASGGKSSFIAGMAGELLSLVSPGKKSSKDEKSKNKSKKEQQAKIDHMAKYDDLTGLPNRSLMMDRIDQAITECKRWKTKFGLIMIDIDNFIP